MSFIGRILKERRVNRRRVVKLPVIKPKLNERRELEAIMLSAVNYIYGYADELLQAAVTPSTVPVLIAVDTGEEIGVSPFALLDSIEDIDRLIKLLILQTQQVMARIEIRIQEWGAKVNKRHEEEFVDGILTATTIDVTTLLHPNVAEQTVEAYVRWSVSLVRDLGDEARRRLEAAVLNAVRNRIPPRELAKQIREIEDMSRRRAINIAADQTNKLNNALDRTRQREAGIDHFTWRHSGKVHFRPHHKRRNGNVYEWDTDQIKAGDFPGEPPFCGCVAQATIVQE